MLYGRKCSFLDLIGSNSFVWENQGCNTFGIIIILFDTTFYELNRIVYLWTKLSLGTLLFYDEELGDASCRNILGHR